MKRSLVALSLLFVFGCAGATVSSPPVNPNQSALEGLREGNARFAGGSASHPHEDPSYRESLAKEQKPKVVVLSCSDSRVPPELVFDQGLGDLFVVRAAGNVADSVAVASLEYAVEHFHPAVLVVLGHDSCGAVKAAVETPPGKSAGSPDLDGLVEKIRKNLRSEKIALGSATKPKDPTLHAEVAANVDAVLQNLLQRSEILRAASHENRLKLVRGVYSLETGRVSFW